MPRRRETKRKLFDCDPKLAERIRNFRHVNRIKTESEAIRMLIIAGLSLRRRYHDDLMERLKANGVGPCSDPVLLRAISESEDYMIGDFFVPIDPAQAEDALLDGEPLDLIWPSHLDARQHAAMAELYRKAAVESGRTVGEVYRMVMEKREQKSRPK